MSNLTKLQEKLIKDIKDLGGYNAFDEKETIKILTENNDLWERGYFYDNTLTLVPSKNTDERFFKFFVNAFRADETDVDTIERSLTLPVHMYEGDEKEFAKDAIKFLKESDSKIAARIWWD